MKTLINNKKLYLNNSAFMPNNLLFIIFYSINILMYSQPTFNNNSISYSGTFKNYNSMSFTTSGNANPILLVSITSVKAVNSISIPGIGNLTLIQSATQASSRTALYYLPSTIVNTTYVLHIAMSASDVVSVVAAEFDNVDSATPFTSANISRGQGASPVCTVICSETDLIIGVLGTIQELPTAGPGHTLISSTNLAGKQHNAMVTKAGSFPTTQVTFSIAGGDDYVLVSVALSSVTPLPVQFISFNAYSNSREVIISWSTAVEMNSDYFTLQRSKDGVSFENVIDIKASGNSSTVKNYSVVDSDPYQGVNYFRVKEIDFDGSFQFSGTVAVTIHSLSDDSLSVFPNPSATLFTVEAGREGQYYLLNEIGQTIRELNLNAENNYKINIESMNSGIYFLVGGSVRKKIVVQK